MRYFFLAFGACHHFGADFRDSHKKPAERGLGGRVVDHIPWLENRLGRGLLRSHAHPGDVHLLRHRCRLDLLATC